MAGAVFEMLALARALSREVVGVVDPTLSRREWRGLPGFALDDEAIATLAPDAVILAIDEPGVRARVQRRYVAAGVPAVDLIAGTIGDGTTWRKAQRCGGCPRGRAGPTDGSSAASPASRRRCA